VEGIEVWSYAFLDFTQADASARSRNGRLPFPTSCWICWFVRKT